MASDGITRKQQSGLDAAETAQKSFNDSDASFNVNGFLVGVVGRRIDLAISTTTIANDTETYSFSENSNPLYALKVVYTDGNRTTMLFAVRIS